MMPIADRDRALKNLEIAIDSVAKRLKHEVENITVGAYLVTKKDGCYDIYKKSNLLTSGIVFLEVAFGIIQHDINGRYRDIIEVKRNNAEYLKWKNDMFFHKHSFDSATSNKALYEDKFLNAKDRMETMRYLLLAGITVR